MKPIKLTPRMDSFLDQQRISCKPSTIDTYRIALRNFSAFLQESPSITQKTTELYLKTLHYSQLAPYSRVNYLLTVRKYLAWEIDQGTIKPNVIQNLSRSALPKVPEYLPRPLSQETDRILTNRLRLSANPHAPEFLLLRLTGLRISELINLSNDCMLTTAKKEHFLKVPLGKMNNERLVPLSSEALGLIEKIKSQSTPCNHLFDPDRLIGVKGHIPHVYHHLHSHFKKLSSDLVDQNKPITFHRLRHTYATSLLSGGVSIVSIMKLLGHKRIEMSLRYAQVTPTHLRQEYFKALNELEHRWIPYQQPSLNIQTPSELVDCLYALLKKQNAPSTQKNLLKRLARLKTDLQKILPPPPLT